MIAVKAELESQEAHEVIITAAGTDSWLGAVDVLSLQDVLAEGQDVGLEERRVDSREVLGVALAHENFRAVSDEHEEVRQERVQIDFDLPRGLVKAQEQLEIRVGAARPLNSLEYFGGRAEVVPRFSQECLRRRSFDH